MQTTHTGDCLIYGTGGHARVLAGLAHLQGLKILRYFDDQPSQEKIDNILVQHYHATFHPDALLLTGIGNNAVRKHIAEKVKHAFATLVHPAAIVASDVTIGAGTVILAGAVVQANVKIGAQVVVNMNAAIDHDVVIGDYASIYPGCYIGGGAVIGEGAVIGPHCVIMRNVQVPAWADIPAGSLLQ